MANAYRDAFSTERMAYRSHVGLDVMIFVSNFSLRLHYM